MFRKTARTKVVCQVCQESGFPNKFIQPIADRVFLRRQARRRRGRCLHSQIARRPYYRGQGSTPASMSSGRIYRHRSGARRGGQQDRRRRPESDRYEPGRGQRVNYYAGGIEGRTGLGQEVPRASMETLRRDPFIDTGLAAATRSDAAATPIKVINRTGVDSFSGAPRPPVR